MFKKAWEQWSWEIPFNLLSLAMFIPVLPQGAPAVLWHVDVLSSCWVRELWAQLAHHPAGATVTRDISHHFGKDLLCHPVNRRQMLVGLTRRHMAVSRCHDKSFWGTHAWYEKLDSSSVNCRSLFCGEGALLVLRLQWACVTGCWKGNLSIKKWEACSGGS